MSGWPRIIRGVVGTALTFAVGVGVVTSVLGGVAILAGIASVDDLRMAARLSVVAFILGIVFSGILATAARSNRLARVSIPRFAAIGALAGFLYYMLIGVTGAFHAWSPALATLNLVLLTTLGAGAAAGTLMLARKSRSPLSALDQPELLTHGHARLDTVFANSRASGSDKLS